MDVNGILNQIGLFFEWLFNSRMGVLALVGGGIVIFLIIAFVLERRTKQMYFNHEKQEGDLDLFDDDEESA